MSRHAATDKADNPKKQRELKKLSRTELLEMLLDVTRENDTLRAENQSLREQLEDKRIRLSESGSIAEAALKLNGIFEAAQKAADQYVDSVKAAFYDAPGDDYDHR